ncbi:DUF2441 domain-containing protein [bacterium]|nr:DUF2441 domain-containing protein [bacterium]
MKKLYHVTRKLPYSPHPELIVGSQITVGKSQNPFFGFYNGERVYEVDTPSGKIPCKAIRFLNAVKNGEVQCPNLPQIACEVASHYLMLARELIMEEVRKDTAPDAPSRQSCMWMARTVDDARVWQAKLNGPSKIIEFKVDGKIHEADAGHLLGDSEPLSVTYDRARKYWLSEVSSKPEPELLFSGVAEVIRIIT